MTTVYMLYIVIICYILLLIVIICNSICIYIFYCYLAYKVYAKNVHKHRFSNKNFVHIYVVTFIAQGTIGVTLGTSHFVNI